MADEGSPRQPSAHESIDEEFEHRDGVENDRPGRAQSERRPGCAARVGRVQPAGASRMTHFVLALQVLDFSAYHNPLPAQGWIGGLHPPYEFGVRATLANSRTVAKPNVLGYDRSAFVCNAKSEFVQPNAEAGRKNSNAYLVGAQQKWHLSRPVVNTSAISMKKTSMFFKTRSEMRPIHKSMLATGRQTELPCFWICRMVARSGYSMRSVA
jgi:hypothetical protein